jgi:pimeloyl-ACP methyl ester carboxylesterase
MPGPPRVRPFPLVALLAAAATAQAPEAARYEPVVDLAPIRQQPYQRLFTQDRFGRRIVSYLSEAPPGGGPFPLVAYVHGSGAQSHFVRVDGRLQGRNGHNTFADVVRGRARLVIVEKPGVVFLDDPPDPGGATRASPMFRSEHTLDRWTEAVHAALEACRKLSSLRPDGVLVAGHSEGGLVAAKLAAEHEWVSHVAVLAGGGPTQLFDLLALARRGELFQQVSQDPAGRVEHVLREWARIEADPDDDEKLFLGHPYRRWSSFLGTSTLEQLLRTRARIYVARGDQDRAVAAESMEIVRAELLARGRKARFDVVAGGDHSFSIEAGGKRTDGWKALLERVLDWFLAP